MLPKEPAVPNPFHLRAKIDRLRRRSANHNPTYIRVKALNSIVRELFAPNPQARLNHQLHLATDPFELARHKLRDLYDRTDPTVPAPEETPVSAPEQGPIAQEQEALEEEDDPL